jgi:hypothetical protein
LVRSKRSMPKEHHAGTEMLAAATIRASYALSRPVAK